MDDNARSGSERLDEEEATFAGLDPQRFTPTLHANLVSEILSLRREVDSKGKLIANLEDQLNGVEQENHHLHQSINATGLEFRELRQRLNLIESGSDNALERLAQERDAVLDTNRELKRKVDAVQTRNKAREEEIERINSLWHSDKQQWEEHQRLMDRRIHVADSRVKLLIQELESLRRDTTTEQPYLHTEDIAHKETGEHQRNSDIAENDNGHEEEGIDVHSTNEPPFVKAIEPRSLADELGSSSDEEDDDGYISDDALPEEVVTRRRPSSSKSNHETAQAYKVLGVPSMDVVHDVKHDDGRTISTVEQNSHPAVESFRAVKPVGYCDKATQWAPPLLTSPRASALDTANRHTGSPSNDIEEDDDSTIENISHEPIIAEPSSAVSEAGKRIVRMISRASQTNVSKTTHQSVTTSSDASTQTDLPFSSPTISITRPSISHSKYPIIDRSTFRPNTHNQASQASASSLYTSNATQTDNISISNFDRVFHPSTSPSKVERQGEEIGRLKNKQTGKVFDIVKAFESDTAGVKLDELEEAENQEISQIVIGEISGDRFDVDEDDIPKVSYDHMELGDLTDNSVASKEPIRKTLTKTKNGWEAITTSRSDQSSTELQVPHPRRPPPPPPTQPLSRKYENHAGILSEEGSQERKSSTNFNYDSQSLTTETNDIREIAGTAHLPKNQFESTNKVRKDRIEEFPNAFEIKGSHFDHASSPGASLSATASDQFLEPPFPVPDRSSSKKLYYDTDSHSQSEAATSLYGSSSYSKRSLGKSASSRRSGLSPSSSRLYKAPYAAFQQNDISENTYILGQTRKSTLSSRPKMGNFDVPEGASRRPKPRSSISTLEKSDAQRSSAIASIHGPSASETISVVDAIAQTMIGEWMWKYVRRRKSFGLPESPAAEFESGKTSDMNAARHQRWVWLAPYERAVMWSTKQPMSGSALMGKSGRKLTIQSVLDVRDETPLPKSAGHSQPFGRSILILTSQRALKFTASSLERHYVWLTALSFLSHTSVLPKTISAIPNASTDHVVPLKALQIEQQASTVSLHRLHDHESSWSLAQKDVNNLNLSANSTRRSQGNEVLASKLHDTSLNTGKLLPIVDSDDEAAEAPLVPRYSGHSRRRSNTGLSSSRTRSFRSFANSHANASKQSIHSSYTMDAGTSNNAQLGGWITDGGSAIRSSVLRSARQGKGSQSKMVFRQANRTSTFEEPLKKPNTGFFERPTSGNFFEAIGTMRMEAFVERLDSVDAKNRRGVLQRSNELAENDFTQEQVRLPQYDSIDNV